MRRCFAWIIVICLLAAGGCAAPAEPAAEETPQPSAEITPAAVAAPRANPAETLVGFIIPDDGSIAMATSMHGFLRTAETLGYPAKLYRAALGAESVAAVEQAKADGCTGLLLWNPDGANDEAAACAAEYGLPVVAPYFNTAAEGVRACVATDLVGYSEEVACGIAQRMVERECKAGKILVYGRGPQEVANAFHEAILTYYPQYNVAWFVRSSPTETGAVRELADYILWNRDIKGLFCTDTDGAEIAVKAREQAQRDFRAYGPPEAPTATPEPTPEAEPAPLPTPTPNAGSLRAPGAAVTPVPDGLIQSITITAAGMGISDANIALMEENDIYAFVLEPYYEASAQALMLLDRILNGESVPAVNRLNMPIVRQDSLEKYRLIFEQVRDWFGMEEGE